jgi:hypothetical protein
VASAKFAHVANKPLSVGIKHPVAPLGGEVEWPMLESRLHVVNGPDLAVGADQSEAAQKPIEPIRGSANVIISLKLVPIFGPFIKELSNPIGRRLNGRVTSVSMRTGEPYASPLAPLIQSDYAIPFDRLARMASWHRVGVIAWVFDHGYIKQPSSIKTLVGTSLASSWHGNQL